MKTTLLITLLALTGCASVPQTELKLPTPLGKLEFISPKQIYASNVVVRTTGQGHLEVLIGTIVSRNDADVIGTLAAGNAAMAEKNVEMLKIIQSMVASGAIRGFPNN